VSAAASAKTALCADESALFHDAGPSGVRGKMMETKLAGLKAVAPKLQAFHDSLDAKRKTRFDTGRRVGGILDWREK
jgi:hypothetical protein